MPPKGKKGKNVVRNIGLESELIRLGVARDAVHDMTREEQSAELDRLHGLAPRDADTAFATLYTDNQQQTAAAAAAALAANPPPPPPAPPAAHNAQAADNVDGPNNADAGHPVQDDQPMDVDDAWVDALFEESPEPAGQVDPIVQRVPLPPGAPGVAQDPGQQDHPMNIDAPERPNNIEHVDLTGDDDWLLQQPMQPPEQPPAELAAPLPQLLGPLSPEAQLTIDNEPDHNRRRELLQTALDEQWRYLWTPPAPPITMNIIHPFEADIQQRIAHLPHHLQAVLSGSWAAPIQRHLLSSPLSVQYTHLYLAYQSIMQRTYSRMAENRRQIDLDPLIPRLPELRDWLHHTDLRIQRRWLNSPHHERLELLREYGLLAWMQQMHTVHYQMEQERYAAQQPQQVPDHLLNAEDLARYGAGFRDYQPWLFSAERRAWIEELRRTGQL
jgi:hypothetical protein